jgi:hypothetical protein
MSPVAIAGGWAVGGCATCGATLHRAELGITACCAAGEGGVVAGLGTGVGPGWRMSSQAQVMHGVPIRAIITAKRAHEKFRRPNRQ